MQICCTVRTEWQSPQPPANPLGLDKRRCLRTAILVWLGVNTVTQSEKSRLRRRRVVCDVDSIEALGRCIEFDQRTQITTDTIIVPPYCRVRPRDHHFKIQGLRNHIQPDTCIFRASKRDGEWHDGLAPGITRPEIDSDEQLTVPQPDIVGSYSSELEAVPARQSKLAETDAGTNQTRDKILLITTPSSKVAFVPRKHIVTLFLTTPHNL